MIGASGGTAIPNTLPLAWINVMLVYRPDGVEVIWGDGVSDAGDDYVPAWYPGEPTEPLFHGVYAQNFPSEDLPSAAVWWATADAFAGSKLWVSPLATPDTGHVANVAETIGQITGGLDELAVYAPNDLQAVLTAEEVAGAGGSSGDYGARVLDDSYLLTSDTRWMADEASTSRVFIHRLDVFVDSVELFLQGDSLPLL